ncbi:MAG: type II secretion system ATPase GspE [Gammaproteobacteria bacterium]|jgi:general secretion pathway protein E|nr:type II secretion system ATPase GspE [Gammaproteobacteria bacterium]MBT5152965.1 type II secretion system ATPase GspE [Gammaproteobacteria bacterium]MBT5685523.1 type II secretion system ATPase GspE [Gammaproteobacteria bacterium]MBT5723200.1 type II secretion system ATPase GspE [Gammaproteobacteria bacterium]MBT6583384.1 type II secretion system ATPase GspE [Gammaproteobacteria bacterium]
MNDLSAIKVLPFGFAKRHGVIVVPSATDAGAVDLVFREGVTAGILAEVRRVCQRAVMPRLVDQAMFDRYLSETYQNDSGAAMQMIEDLGDEVDLSSLAESIPETGDLLEQEDDAPIIKLINSLLGEAVKLAASDIHIETYETRLVVRFRVDGVLREIVSPRRALAPLLVSRIKVMAKLDIAEKRLPQDGRISIRIGGKEVDVRVSTIPASNGERVVMRLLDKHEGMRDLSHLGMSLRDNEAMSSLVQRPHGILLVTGPTGSGKSTTLYACLDQLNDQSRNILTVEDPIEYDIEGIGQTQVNAKADMTFAKGLRAILRQDPDVVMVGEIRDFETADISVQASLTGHLVLSTLHTNTAIGAVTRLANMGVQPYLLSNSLIGLVAQRLVRVLCTHCREAHLADEYECNFLKAEPSNPPTIYRVSGCEACANEGYRGRMGIYEVVSVDDDLRRMIHSGASELDMEQYVRGRATSIRDDGRARVLEGLTTVDEVLRITMEE